MENETNVLPFENLTDVSIVKEMLISWLENGARDSKTLHLCRVANLIPSTIFKRAKEELGVISFICPIKKYRLYALPDNMRRCFGCRGKLL